MISDMAANLCQSKVWPTEGKRGTSKLSLLQHLSLASRFCKTSLRKSNKVLHFSKDRISLLHEMEHRGELVFEEALGLFFLDFYIVSQ